MPDDRGKLDDLDALDRAVSEAAWGRMIGSDREIEPSLAATIRTVAAMQRSARPAPAFTARLSAQLANEEKQISPGRGNDIVSRFQAYVPSLAAHSPSMARPTSPRRWLIAQASLALLLVVLAGGLWLTAFRGDPGGGRPFAESILVPERGTATTTAYYAVYLRRVSFEPGARLSELSTGSTLILVEEGAFGVRGTGRFDEETYKPNETFAVAKGTKVDLQNTSNGTGTILIAGLYSLGHSSSFAYVPGLDVSTIGSGVFAVSLPDPVRFTLQRKTVPAGQTADVGQTRGPAMIRIEEGDVGLTLTGNSVPAPFQSGVEGSGVVSRTVQLPSDVNITARNTGMTPLVLTIVAVSPVSESTT